MRGAYAVVATNGEFVELLVKLNDKVEAGQTVAVQRNTSGEVVAEYTSGVTGEVGACRTDAISEPANMLVTVLYNRSHLTLSTPHLSDVRLRNGRPDDK